MNNRQRNKDKAIRRYCDKVKMGGGTLYVPKNSWSPKIQFKTTEGIWSISPMEWKYEG